MSHLCIMELEYADKATTFTDTSGVLDKLEAAIRSYKQNVERCEDLIAAVVGEITARCSQQTPDDKATTLPSATAPLEQVVSIDNAPHIIVTAIVPTGIA